jgi:dTMP kinase
MFITLEGIDYSGKTTQAKLLVERLKKTKKEVIFLREPGGTNISEKIRSILLDKQHLELTQIAELFLFSAARHQLVTEVIKPALKSGKFVVCDRYDDSTTAYQGYGRGIDLNDVRLINRIATEGLRPDLTFYLDVQIEEIFKRQQSKNVSTDRMEESGRIFFEKVRKGYLVLAKEEPERFIVVNGNRQIDIIHNEIWEIIKQRIEKND